MFKRKLPSEPTGLYVYKYVYAYKYTFFDKQTSLKTIVKSRE